MTVVRSAVPVVEFKIVNGREHYLAKRLKKILLKKKNRSRVMNEWITLVCPHDRARLLV